MAQETERPCESCKYGYRRPGDILVQIAWGITILLGWFTVIVRSYLLSMRYLISSFIFMLMMRTKHTIKPL